MLLSLTTPYLPSPVMYFFQWPPMGPEDITIFSPSALIYSASCLAFQPEEGWRAPTCHPLFNLSPAWLNKGKTEQRERTEMGREEHSQKERQDLTSKNKGTLQKLSVPLFAYFGWCTLPLNIQRLTFMEMTQLLHYRHIYSPINITNKDCERSNNILASSFF